MNGQTDASFKFYKLIAFIRYYMCNNNNVNVQWGLDINKIAWKRVQAVEITLLRSVAEINLSDVLSKIIQGIVILEIIRMYSQYINKQKRCQLH